MSDNYLEQIVDDIYDILRDGPVASSQFWPKGIKQDQKIEFLNKLINYYQSIDEFERCAHLKQMIGAIKMIDALFPVKNITKTSNSGSTKK